MGAGLTPEAAQGVADLFNAAGWMVLGIALVVLALLLKWLGPLIINVTFFILLVAGIVAIIGGIVGMVSGAGRRSSDF